MVRILLSLIYNFKKTQKNDDTATKKKVCGVSNYRLPQSVGTLDPEHGNNQLVTLATKLVSLWHLNTTDCCRITSLWL